MASPGAGGYYGGGSSGGQGVDDGNGREKGYRRRRLAEMAGNVYRAGAAAVGEIRESYAQTRSIDMDAFGRPTIPGSFPNVAITVHGDDQMVIFPSYAKRHVKKTWGPSYQHHNNAQHGTIQDEDYWRAEWERNQDEDAIVDVDVRGWFYSPHRGPLTRKNRILMGLARQLSGIPRPDKQVAANAEDTLGSLHRHHEDLREQEKIAREAARIERIGQEEKNAASRGDYSEAPGRAEEDFDHESIYPSKSGSGMQTPSSAPSSPTLPPRQAAAAHEMSDAELAVANANLMARIAPFMTTPLVQIPITVFFYNDEKSQSRTVITNEVGHFITRAALDFVPTHIRVLANENISAIQEVKIIEPDGVSLISDIDDTIKRSNISGGAREIFRNTFVRDLADLNIEGVREWYGRMHELGVSIHYCSNSPWQLFPVLASYFLQAGLPPGSLHLKQYSGMLQGIFEPVAERKRSTLDRLMLDFPQRKFILVGDSGEADLEVYTELAAANPKRILAIFIRDVTTPEQTDFFDKSFDIPAAAKRGAIADKKELQVDGPSEEARPALPPRPYLAQSADSQRPESQTNLIDLADEPEETSLGHSETLSQLRREAPPRTVSSPDIAAKAPPPRPSKPAALRSTPPPSSDHLPSSGGPGEGKSASKPAPPPPRSRKASPAVTEKSHPLSQVHNSSQQSVKSQENTPQTPPEIPHKTKPQFNPNASSNDPNKPIPPPPPPPRRRMTPSNVRSLSPRLRAHVRSRSATGSPNADVADLDAPLPKSLAPPPSGSSRSSTVSPAPSVNEAPLDKKLQLWRTRLERAQDTLDRLGVALYTWRRGHDVIEEAVGIVQKAMGEKLEGKKGRR